MLTFTLITLLHIPAFSIYRSYSNYVEDASDAFLKSMSMGNMGFSSPKCVSSGMAAN